MGFCFARIYLKRLKMKFPHLVIAVVAFMAINSESKPQQPQITTRGRRDAGDNCCNRVRGQALEGSSDYAKDDQGTRFAYYSKKLGMINDRPHYTSDDGESGIWHDGNSWNVGSLGAKGTGRSGLYAKSLQSCPEDPTYSWQYHAGNDEYKPANKGFSIYCYDRSGRLPPPP